MLDCHAAILTRCDSRADFGVCPCCGYSVAGEPFDACPCSSYSAAAGSPFGACLCSAFKQKSSRLLNIIFLFLEEHIYYFHFAVKIN